VRPVLRKLVFNIEFEWTRPRNGIAQHGPDSPLIPDKWKPKEKAVVTAREIVDEPSEGLTLPSEAHWFSIDLTDVEHDKYQPLKEQTVLHREFSEIPRFPVSPQAIEEFANKYGLLGIGEPLRTKSGVLMIESSSQWEHEIGSMWDAIQVWDCLNGVSLSNTQDQEQPPIKRTKEGFWYQSLALRKVIERDPAFGKMLGKYRRAYDTCGLAFFDDDNYVAGPLRPSKSLKDWQSRDAERGPTKQYLVNIINQHLIGNVVPQFQLERHGTGNEDILTSIAPQNLLGALWLQFFLEITWGHVRRCLICKTPFVAQREDQVYCHTNGTGCRKKADRVRSAVLRDGRRRSQVTAKYGISSDDLDKIMARRRTKQDHTAIA